MINKKMLSSCIVGKVGYSIFLASPIVENFNSGYFSPSRIHLDHSLKKDMSLALWKYSAK